MRQVKRFEYNSQSSFIKDILLNRTHSIQLALDWDNRRCDIKSITWCKEREKDNNVSDTDPTTLTPSVDENIVRKCELLAEKCVTCGTKATVRNMKVKHWVQGANGIHRNVYRNVAVWICGTTSFRMASNPVLDARGDNNNSIVSITASSKRKKTSSR